MALKFYVMILQLLALSLIFVGLTLAGLGVKLIVQVQSRLSDTHVNRYREIQKMMKSNNEKHTGKN